MLTPTARAASAGSYDMAAAGLSRDTQPSKCRMLQVQRQNTIVKLRCILHMPVIHKPQSRNVTSRPERQAGEGQRNNGFAFVKAAVWELCAPPSPRHSRWPFPFRPCSSHAKLLQCPSMSSNLSRVYTAAWHAIGTNPPTPVQAQTHNHDANIIPNKHQNLLIY